MPQMLHNAICLVTAWRKIRFGFIITPMQLVNPNQVQILMLVVHLFQILPTYVPRVKVCANKINNFVVFYPPLPRHNTLADTFLILKYIVSYYACKLNHITIIDVIVQIKFSCSLTQTVTKQISVSNPMDKIVKYVLLLVNDVSQCFTILMPPSVLRLNEHGSGQIQIQFQAKKMQRIRGKAQLHLDLFCLCFRIPPIRIASDISTRQDVSK